MTKLYLPTSAYSGSTIHTAKVKGRCVCGRLISEGDEYVDGPRKVGARVPQQRVRICMDCACGTARGGVAMGQGA
jgi:hypothetical protein